MSLLRNCSVYYSKPVMNTLKYQFRILHKSIPSLNKSKVCQPQCPPKKEKCPTTPKETPCLPKQNVDAESLFRMPHILRIIGPKHISIVTAFIPSLVIYGVAALIAVVYISEFKTVLQYLPFYNTVYKEEEPPKPKPKKESPPPPSSDEEPEKNQC